MHQTLLYESISYFENKRKTAKRKKTLKFDKNGKKGFS